MNFLNRLLVSIGALAVAGIAGLVLGVSAGLLRPEELLRLPWQLLLEPARLAEGADRAWLVALSAGTVPLALALVVLEWGTLRAPQRGITLAKTPGGAVTVGMRSLRELADRLGGEQPGVLEIRTQVREQGHRLHVVGDVSVDPGQPLPALVEALQGRIKDGIERHVGRAVAEVRVHARFGPLDAAGARAPRVQ